MTATPRPLAERLRYYASDGRVPSADPPDDWVEVPREEVCAAADSLDAYERLEQVCEDLQRRMSLRPEDIEDLRVAACCNTDFEQTDAQKWVQLFIDFWVDPMRDVLATLDDLRRSQR